MATPTKTADDESRASVAVRGVKHKQASVAHGSVDDVPSHSSGGSSQSMRVVLAKMEK
jgi:hypothetical protein